MSDPWIVLEAAPSHIIVRIIDRKNEVLFPDSFQDTVHLHGCYLETEVGSLKALISACQPYRLPQKCEIALEDIPFSATESFELGITRSSHIFSQDESYLSKLSRRVISAVEAMQHNSVMAQLPSGWWYDGSGFIDIVGSRRNLHPSARSFADIFLERVNRSNRAFNSLLDEVDDYIY
jgi:hypothetical protein